MFMNPCIVIQLWK